VRVHPDRKPPGMKRFASAAELAAAVGEQLGPSDWVLVDQKRVDEFAEATGDDQWIHVDPERAASGPFGTTIAHGFLTLSLLPVLTGALYDVDGLAMRVNYGLNRVRFPAPVLVPSSVRAHARIAVVEPVTGGYQVVSEVTVESDRSPSGKPVCVAESVARIYPVAPDAGA
jgi:acyl dehydratase